MFKKVYDTFTTFAVGVFKVATLPAAAVINSVKAQNEFERSGREPKPGHTR